MQPVLAVGQGAGEGPQPRVYTISGEPALLPGPEAEPWRHTRGSLSSPS